MDTLLGQQILDAKSRIDMMSTVDPHLILRNVVDHRLESLILDLEILIILQIIHQIIEIGSLILLENFLRSMLEDHRRLLLMKDIQRVPLHRKLNFEEMCLNLYLLGNLNMDKNVNTIRPITLLPTMEMTMRYFLLLKV